MRGLNRCGLIVTLTLCAFAGIALRAAATDAPSLPGLRPPQPYRVLTPLEQWQQRGYTELSLPELGETNRALTELHSRMTLFPGVDFQAPEFPEKYLAAHGVSSTQNVYDRNQALIANLQETDPLAAAETWVSTQLPHGAWDYKYAVQSDPALKPMWRMFDAIGYFNGAYTGDQIFGRDLLLRGFGAYKTLSQQSAGKQGFGPLTLGNKPEGYVWAQMGLDYYEKGQSVRQFLDNGEANSSTTVAGLKLLYEIDRLTRRSFAEEFQQRWQELKVRAKQRDQKTYSYMLKVEQDEAKEQALELKQEEAFQEALRREQEHNREIEEQIRNWAPQPSPSQSQPYCAGGCQPALPWQQPSPPPWQTQTWKPPSSPFTPTLPPLPEPQRPLWSPIIIYHSSSAGGGYVPCDEDCGESGGQPDVQIRPRP